MNNERILELVNQVDIKGLLSAEVRQVTKAGDSCVVIKFLRLKGMLRNNQEMTISLFIDPEGPNGDLFFFAPPLETCKPGDLELTIYMDANYLTHYGAHRWNPKDGDVVFSYSIPSSPECYLDAPIMQRILFEIYRSLLHREVKSQELKIQEDDMLGPEEKDKQLAKLNEIYNGMIGPREVEDTAV